MNTSNQINEEKPQLTGEQKQKMKKYAVFALMGVICAGCMWFIFSPSAKEKAKQEAQAGFNSEIPLPKEAGLISDKRDAYEQEQMKQKQSEQMRSLSDFSSLLSGESDRQSANDLALLADEPQTEKLSGSTSAASKPTAVQNSVNAYRDINRSLGSFYESPKNDPEKERLQQELNDLKSRLDETDNRKKSVDEQMALMEKSFQMAAKYMPGMTGTGATAAVNGTSAMPEPANGGNGGSAVSGKGVFVPVGRADVQTVYSLAGQNMSNREFIETFSVPRNMGFITVANSPDAGMKNTISACVHEDKTVTDGQNVRLRLLEPMRVGKIPVPRNTLFSGTAKIQGERLDITVHFLEYRGTILPVELTVYDLDGQAGIFIPNLQELNAAKEVVANMGTSAGTSINLSNDAGKQFAADMGRNLIQGVSQFAAKKLREVKVNLKAGYRIYLVSEIQLKDSQALANK